MKLYCKKCEKIFTAEAPEAGSAVECPACHQQIPFPETPTSPGAVIGDFLIERHLSKGGMGDVFLAHQLSLDRPAALKVLQSNFVDDKEYVESLIHEARAAAKLNHPNIVQAYAVGEEDGHFYFAMEFVSGRTYKEILKEEKVLDFERAAKVIRDVADALQFAWNEQKLVHQDIKPDNIMCDSSGRTKLADLGLARSANADFDTDAEEVLGTPQYISPEQLTGVPTDVRSDIYSLGATFYQFVTGRFPYVSDSVEELAKMHVAGNLEPPKQVNPDLPDELNAIIMKMMARKLNERYQTPGVLIQALDLYLNARKKTGGVPSLKLKPHAAAAPSLKLKPIPPALSKPSAQTEKKEEPPAASVPALKPAAASAATPVLRKPAPAAPSVILKPTPAATPAAVPVPEPVLKAKPQPPTPAPVPAAPAAEPKKETEKTEVADTPEKKDETDETGEDKKRFSLAFLKKPVVLWSAGVLLLVILLIAGSGAALFFLHRADKLPKFLKPAGAWLAGKIRCTPAAPQPSSVPAAKQLPPKQLKQEKKVLPPPTPVKPAEPPPKPVTRQIYMNAVKSLSKWHQENPGKLPEFMQKFSEQWDLFTSPQTAEERAEFDQFWTDIASDDEVHNFVPGRDKARERHQKETQTRRNEREKKLKDAAEQLAKLRQQQQENSRKIAEEAQKTREEAKRREAARIQKVQAELRPFFPKFRDAFVIWAYDGKGGRYEEVKKEFDEWLLPPESQTPEEKNLHARVKAFSAAIPKEVRKMKDIRTEMGKIRTQIGLEKIVTFSPEQILVQKGGNKPHELNLARNRNRIKQLLTNQDKAWVFYFGIMRKELWVKEREIPSDFWKKYWDLLKVIVQK